MVKSYIGALVRSLLQVIAGVLVAKGVITSDKVTSFVEVNTEIVAGVLVYAVSFAWSLLHKYWAAIALERLARIKLGGVFYDIPPAVK